MGLELVMRHNRVERIRILKDGDRHFEMEIGILIEPVSTVPMPLMSSKRFTDLKMFLEQGNSVLFG